MTARTNGCATSVLLALAVAFAEYVLFFMAWGYSAKTCSGELGTILILLALFTPPFIYFMIDFHLRRKVGSAIARTFIVGFAAMVPIAIAVPSMLHAPQRTRQKVTLERIREIANRMEQSRAQQGAYPVSVRVAEVDGWCQPFSIRSTGQHYEIVSFGRNGKPDVVRSEDYAGGATTNFENDIVFRDGALFRYPEGVQP